MQVLHRLPGLLARVRSEIIHKNAELGVAIHFSELGQVLLELRNVHRLGEQHVQFLPSLLGYARKQCHCRLVGLRLVDVQVLLRQAVLRLRQRRLREHGLVEVDDSVPVFPGLVQLPQQLLFLSLVLLLGSVVGLLLPCNSSFLDAVLLVDLAQQRVAHPAARELFHEVLGPVLQRHAGLPRQRLRIHQPIDLMRL